MRSKGETLLMGYWWVCSWLHSWPLAWLCHRTLQELRRLDAAGASDWRFKNRRGSPVKNSLSLNGVSMIRGYWIFNWSFNASDSLSAIRRCSTSVVVGQFWFSSKSSGIVCLFVWSFDYLTLVEQSFVGCQLLLNDVERSLSFLTVFTSQSQSFTADRFQRF